MLDTNANSYAPSTNAEWTPSPELSPDLFREPSTKTPLNPVAAEHLTRKRENRRSKWRTMKRILIVLGVLALLGIGSVLMFRFIKTDEFNDVIEWIQDHQLIGSAIYVGSFTLFIILCFPSTAFELLAGYIFGFWLGLLLASIGKLAGSVLAFFIGRYLCRRRVKEYMERGHPVFKAFQSLLRKRQVLIVFLTRTAFFPIAMKNYGLSVLDVSFTVYFAAALLTGLPFSIIWVYSGNAAQHLTALLASNTSKSKTEAVFLVVGASSALLLLFFIGFYTRKHVMKLAEDEENAATALRREKDATMAKQLYTSEV